MAYEKKGLVLFIATIFVLSVFLTVSATADDFTPMNHNATVTISPNIANCDTIPSEYTVNIENDGGSDSYGIYNVKIYKAQTNIVDIICGPAPSGWTFDGFKFGLYCEYSTNPEGTDVIENGENLDFTFNASVVQEQCASTFRVSTLDNEAIVAGGSGAEKDHYLQLLVDCTDPVLEKVVGLPKIPGPVDGWDYWINANTTLYFTVTDSTSLDECNLGVDYCEYVVIRDGTVISNRNLTFENGEVLKWEDSFDEDCNHEIFIECYDLAGNMVELYEWDKVDVTPPVTTKTISDPKKIFKGVEWIDSITEITLSAVDPDPTEEGCNIGVNKTLYRITQVEDNYCRYPDTYCHHSSFVFAPSATYIEINNSFLEYDGEPITDISESCHMMEYFSVDHLGNVEEIQTNCFFVDKTAPYMHKDNGDAICDEGEGEPAFKTDENTEGKFYWITSSMPIVFTCDDTWAEAPHPSEDEQFCFKVSYDYVYNEGTEEYEWGYITEDYCDGELDTDGFCCVDVDENKEFEFFFNKGEESMHNLEYYCIDAVDKKTDVRIQYYKVDDTEPWIEKYMIGEDHLGDCPNGTNIDHGDCYVRDDELNGVRIEAYDGGEICAVGVEECVYSLWWLTDKDTCIGKDYSWNSSSGKCRVENGSFEDYIEIFFHEDSTHELVVQCWDLLGNMMDEHVEEFLVDSTPPETTKTYGEPKVFNGTHRWINRLTPITLKAEDEKVGVDKIYWRYEWVSNETCPVYPVLPPKVIKPFVVSDDPDDDIDWNVEEGDSVTFTINESSCHLIAYYAVDLLGNEEELKWQYVMVDNEEPFAEKIVGEPNIPIDGGVCTNETGEISDTLDVFFLFDLTGSMGGVLDSARTEANDLMTDLSALVPDSQFGAGSFMDYNGSFSHCGYSSTYGSGIDYPYRLDQDITDDKVAVSSAIDGLILGYGNDGPESYTRALWETQFLSWRPGAQRVVVIFQDNVPHDCNLGAFAGCTSTTGTDPGIDEIVGTVDDLNWIDTAALLKAQGITVISVDTGSANTCRDSVWGYMANETGGINAYLGEDFTDTIVSLVGEVIIKCDGGDYYVNQNTLIKLVCEDVMPHPVEGERVGFKVYNDGDDITDSYCDFYEGEMVEGYCVVSGTSFEFNFKEDSEHILKWYCEDALGNRNERPDQFYYVETVPPVTTHEILEPYYIDANGTLYIDTATLINLTAYDPEPHPSGVNETYYTWLQVNASVCWEYFQQGFVDSVGVSAAIEKPLQVYDEPFGIPEESCHWIQYYSIDNLGNEEPVNEFYVFVDKTPPVLSKMVGEPKYPLWEARTFEDVEIGPDMFGFVKPSEPEFETALSVKVEDGFIKWIADLENKSGVTASGFQLMIDLGYGDIFTWGVNAPDGAVYKEYDGGWTVKPTPAGFNSINESPDTYYELWIPVTYFMDSFYWAVNSEMDWDGTSGAVQSNFPHNWGRWSNPTLNTERFELLDWYVNIGTEVTMWCFDPDPHPSGVDYLSFRVNYSEDDQHDLQAITDEYCADVGGTLDGEWCRVDVPDDFEEGVTIEFKEESFHSLEFACTDNVEKTSDIRLQHYWVDATPPETNKTIGNPKTPMSEGNIELGYYYFNEENGFDPALTQEFCDKGEQNCMEVTLLTRIDLACVDPEPHPSGGEAVYFMVHWDGDDVTSEYCGDEGWYIDDHEHPYYGYCYLEEGTNSFYFKKETWHRLEYFCEDNVGNVGEPDIEYFKVEGTAFEIDLNKKWNLISVPVKLLDNSMDDVFGEHDNVVSVWAFDGTDWSVWSPDAPSDLTTMEPGWGYWVLTTDPSTLVIGGSLLSPTVTPPDVSIVHGWNLIGYYGADEAPVRGDPEVPYYSGPSKSSNGKYAYCALGTLMSSWFDMVFPSLWTYWEPNNPDVWIDLGEYDYMNPGAGYWLFYSGPDGGIYGPSTTCGMWWGP